MSTIIKIVGQITLKALTDVESTTYYYLLQSSMAPAPSAPTTNPPTGGWSTTEPEFFIYMPTQDTTIIPGKDYYTRSGAEGSYVYTKVLEPSASSLSNYYEKIYGDTRSLYVTVQTLYTDTTFEYSEPSLSSSYEAAKEAYNRAKTALDLAGDTSQYFWSLSSAHSTNVPAGVYVTRIPQGQFKASPAQGNILMQNTGLTIRNGAISLASLTGDALNFYNPTTHNPAMQLSGQALNFYNPNSDNLTLSLNSSGLNFYGSSTSTSDASLTSTGLVLSKGGVKAGTDGQKGFVYLSSEDYPLKDATNSGLTINTHTPTAQGTDGKTEDDPAWREVIGSRFGVDSEGNLYANNAHLSGANVEGAITATSLTIGSGSSAYDGTAAINISGYTIEITTDSTEVVDADTTVYLYPHLYHNGIEVTTGIDYSHFIWYRDGETIGTEGDINNQGRYLATYGDSYRVIYDFDDGAVGGGTEVQTRTVDPSKYITRINDTGITIHPEIWNNESSYIQLDGTGMELFDSDKVSIAQYGTTTRIGFINGKNIYLDNNGMQIRSGLTSLASFGTTAQIGQDNSSRFLMNSDSLQAYNSNNQKYFEVTNNELRWGTNTAATTTQVEAAAQTVNHYITEIDNSGIFISPLNQSPTESLPGNSVKIDATGMDVYMSGNSVAKYGNTARVGKIDGSRIEISSSRLKVVSDLGTTSFQTGTGTDEVYDYQSVPVQNINYQIIQGQIKVFDLDLSMVNDNSDFYVQVSIYAIGKYSNFSDVFNSRCVCTFKKGTSTTEICNIWYPADYDGTSFSQDAIDINLIYNANANTLTVSPTASWPAVSSSIHNLTCTLDDISIVKAVLASATEIYGSLRLDVGNYYIGTSDTAAGTATKIVTTINEDFELVEGAEVYVTFSNTQTATSTYLQIDNAPSKPAYLGDHINPDWAAGDTVIFYYSADDDYFYQYPIYSIFGSGDANERIVSSIIELDWVDGVLI